MTISRFVLAAALASLAAAGPASAQTTRADAVFAQRVQAATVDAATETWKSIAGSLSSNPLFAALGLGSVKYEGGNRFSHSATLKLGTVSLAVKGDMYIDPAAVEGRPLVSLQSVTTFPDGDRNLSFGALHALSGRLDLVVMREGGGRKMYARVVPSFTSGPAPPPTLVLSAAPGGALDAALTGASLKLSDIVPVAANIPVLNDFVLKSAKKSASSVAVAGTFKGKAVSVTKDDAKDDFSLTGAGLTLVDLVPAAAPATFLQRFVFDGLTATSAAYTVNGAIAGKAVAVTMYPKAGSFVATGAGLSLAAVIPDAAKIPVLGKFAFSSVSYAPGAVSVAGALNGKAVTVARSPAGFTLTGADLLLADFVPAVSGAPFLSAFAFDSLVASSAAVAVSGKISGKGVVVTRSLAATTDFSVKGDALKLGDIVPEAAGIKAFDKLSLSLVSVNAKQVRVDGALGGKAISFVRTRDPKPKTTVTAAALTLADLYDALASVPTLNAVAVDKLTLDGSSVEAQVQLNGATVDVVAHAAGGGDAGYAAVFFKTLDAATFVPAAQGHAVNDVALRNALFLILPADASAKTVTAADLPGSLPGLVGWDKAETLSLSAGVNFAASLDLSGTGKAAAALKTAGVDASALPLRGTLSSAAFKAMGGKAKGAASSLAAADKQSLLSGLKLKASVPLPKLPAIAGLVAVKGPAVLAFGGNAQDPNGPWGRIPSGLSAFKPAGDVDFSLQFGVDIVGAGINDSLLAFVSVDKGAQPGLTMLAVQKNAWAKPFGIDGLTLTSGGFKFSLETPKAGAPATEDLAFFASALIGSKKDVAVSAELKRKDGKVSLDYFEFDGPFALSDFPGGGGIPNGDKFSLDTLKLSPQGIEAKTTLSGKKVDAFLFNAAAAGAAPSWTFALDQKNFKIVELIPAAKAILPLANMTIPNAALIITQNGLTLSKAGSTGVAADLLSDIFGKTASSVKIPGGVALIAAFDPASMGFVGKGLSKIGVHDDAVISGEITGVFQGTPGLRLSFVMDEAGAAHGLPGKAMSYKAGVAPSFFLLWGGEDLEVGLKIPMMVKAGKDLLELSSSLELEFMPEGVGIKVLGSMDGTWHEPFGVKGITLANLKMDAAIDDVGEAQIGFAGDEQFGKCDGAGKGTKDCLDVNLAVSVKILLEDALPDGVAFAGTVNELGIPAVIDIAETFLKVPGQLSKLPVPFFTIKNAKMAFATPGATDPDLGLVSEGFAFGGTFNFMSKDLGKISGAGGPTTGVAFKGKIADIDLDVLKFSNNDVDIAVNLDPKFIINSDVKVLGAAQRVKLDIEPPHFEFDVVEKLGVFGDAMLTVRLDGFDLAKGTFDKNADISVVGEFKSTLEPWLEGEIKKGVEELRASASAKLDADSKALSDAQAKVNGINDQIAKIKADDDKAKARAEASINGVLQRVNSLQSSYDHEIYEAHHCGSRWTHWACSPGWYVAAGGTYVSLKAAQGVLEAAKAAVAAAFDLDPRLVGLYAERDIETAGLAIAQAVVTATKAVEDFVLKELENILIAALKDFPFDVEQAILLGDLKAMIANNEPLVLDLKFKIAGQEMREYFAVKIPDSPANVEFDAVAFALLPALALDSLTEAALGKISPDIKTWVHAHIASKLAEAEAKVREQVQAEEEKYKDVLATFENGSAKYQKAFADQGQIHAQLVAQTELTDLMPPSLEYANTYLAVGHSALCLTVSKDGVKVIQADCKDDAPERWSTAKLDGGYVQLKSKGLCLKARQGGAADSNEPLVLAQCDSDDKHEQWKIITDDGFYDKIVNRDSQKCLHFNDENANPDTAYAVWTDCLGADSQNFRDLPDAERPDYKDVNSMVKASNGQCLSVTNAAGQADFAPKAGDTEERLYSRACDDKNERFNYTEMVNGDVKLVHGETGTCLYPKDKATLAIRPCDTGKDMFWRVNAQGGKGFQLLNNSAGLCLMLPTPAKGQSQAPAALAACNRVPNDGLLLDFVK